MINLKLYPRSDPIKKKRQKPNGENCFNREKNDFCIPAHSTGS